MTNFSNTSLPPVGDGRLNNSSGRPEQYFDAHDIIAVFTSCICIIGLVGNGIVIYLLGFRIKGSPFTMCVLNLAVADFGVLLFLPPHLVLLVIPETTLAFYSLYKISLMGAIFMYTASQLLLTAINIDRCVSGLFPTWHRCHRPPRLPTTVCAIIWVLSCLPSGSLVTLPIHFFYPFITGAVLCLPLVTISTLILLFKVFCKPWQLRRGRLLSTVLLTLLFYLIFASPLNAICTHYYFTDLKYSDPTIYGILSSSLNSCVHPLIYYMVGRKKRGQERQSLKVILQRAFEEKEENREEGATTAQTSL